MFETDTLAILYGVQATGNGHITRSREMVKALRDRGHHVEVIVSGRKKEDLWGMEPFKPFHHFEGLTFQTEKGRVQLLQTLAKARPFQMLRDVRSFPAKHIDLVVTDYEPISARVAAQHGIPCIGIGHQYAFEYDIPKANFNPVNKWFMSEFAPVDIGVGLHWHHFDQAILPPIIPRITQFERPLKNTTLVYLPFEDHSKLLKILRNFPSQRFILYSDQVPAGRNGHITVKPHSRETFPVDLAMAEGVICNSGFELPSEAISLGKKILVKPLKGQPEQSSNAMAMNALKVGHTTDDISVLSIQDWLRSELRGQICFPQVVPALIDWLEAGQWDKVSLGLLAEQIWSGVYEDPVLSWEMENSLDDEDMELEVLMGADQSPTVWCR